MKFSYLIFRNYRPYYGEQRINFLDDQSDNSPINRNITLIGGLNGAGKTSLINAIHFCLYGRRKFSKETYEEILNNAINKKYFYEGGRESSIELGFINNSGTYAIKVNFNYDIIKNKVTEERVIFKYYDENSKVPITSTDSEFNEFIDKSIPIDVASFFIFDAEKIRELVGELDEDETITAIQKVVSLDLYNTLYKDLEHISNEDTRELRKIDNSKKSEELINQLHEISNSIESTEEKRDELEQQLQKLYFDKTEAEKNIREKLAKSSATKQTFAKTIGSKTNELNRINSDIEEFGRESLPKLILTPLINKLKSNLRKEKDYVEKKEREKIKFSPYDRFISELLDIEMYPPLSDKQIQALKERGKKIWAKLNQIKVNSFEKIEILHDLSNSDYNRIQSYETGVKLTINDLIDKKHQIEKELIDLQRKLENAPEETISVEKENEKLNQINQHIGSVKNELKSVRATLKKLRDQQINLKNEISRNLKKMDELTPVQERIQIIDKYLNAAQEFINKVTILKANQLKNEIENILNKLFRKSDFERVEFNPENYRLEVYDNFNNRVDLNSRSEGEKQIISLCMIWALTKVSGVNFPFVIDTPLARLDSVHRKNIVEHYFTVLSDQVIILSTDTEITKDFVEIIKPYVNFSYLLDYDEENEITKIKDGYFSFEGEESII